MLARGDPLRMEAHHEGFAQMHLRRIGPQHLELARSHRHRLLAQHMLAGLRRGERQRNVEVIRQRVVDRFDRRVGEERVVGPVGPRDAECRRSLLRRGEAARGQRRDLQQRALEHAGNRALSADLGGGEDAPANRCHGASR